MFDAFIAHHARNKPRALAALTPRKRATYAELDADVNRFAVGLVGLGVTPDRGIVAVEATTAYHQLLLLLALARLGVTSTWQDDHEADYRISQRGGETDDRVLRLTPDWTARTEAAPHIVMPTARRDPDSLARVMLSSGTTRAPRRIPYTWRRIEANCLNGMAIYGAGRLGTWIVRTGVDSGLGFLLSALAWTVGATVATELANADLPGVMERQPAGLIGLTPIQLRELLDVLPQGFELQPRWRVVVGGGVLPPSVAREARERLTPDVLIVYGAVESGRASSGPATLLETTPGAAGWPLPGVEVEVVGPDGARLPDGEQGEIRIRSERIGDGYLGNPEASARVFRDGYVYPGDLGRRLPDGMLVIDGRVDERMNIGGVKVLPNLLEDAALSHAGVRDCAAFALPDGRGQDQCWLAVAPNGDLTRDALLAHINRSGVRFPAIRFAWTAEIPRNTGGKIDRERLRSETLAALRPGDQPA